MQKTLVRCPKCKKVFFTEKKEDCQCRGDKKPCGNRFPVKDNTVNV